MMMGLFARFLVSAPVLACLLAGCSTAGSFTRSLEEKDSGGTYRLEPGDSVRVMLESNPTTGYLWVQDGVPDPAVIRLVSDKFEQPEKKNLCGAPGKQVFIYHVVGGGDAAVKLVYRRPWEREKPDGVFQIRIVSTAKQSLMDRLKQDDSETPRVGSRGQIEPPVR